jgi:hypothetical protein
MSGIPSRAGGFVDDVIEFLKSEDSDLWTKWCELAGKVGTTGEMLLSGRGLEGQWDGGVINAILSHNSYRSLLQNEMLKRIYNALLSEDWLLKGYTDNLEERTAPPELIIFDTLPGALSSSSIVLANKTNLSSIRLIRAPAQVAAASQVTAPTGSAKARHKPAGDDKVRQLMLAECIAAKKSRTKPPNENDFYRLVNARLKPEGLKAGWKQIRRIWTEEIFEEYKLEAGQHFSEDFWES